MSFSLVLVAATALLAGCADQATRPPHRQAPRRITAQGRLEPATRIRRVSLSSPLSGDRIGRILVRQHQWVQQGQALAVLHSHDTLRAALRQTEQLVALQRERREQLQADARRVEQRQLRDLEMRLRSLERRLAAERRRQDRVVAQRRRRLEEARREAERLEPLFRTGGLSEMEWDRHRSRARSSEAALHGAIETRTASLQRLQAEISDAREMQVQLRQLRPLDGAAVESELRQAYSSRDRARGALAAATVRAPQDGLVLRILARPGDRVAGANLLELVDSRRMIVTAGLDPVHLGRIRPGLGATIQAAGLDGSLRGRVLRLLPPQPEAGRSPSRPGVAVAQNRMQGRLQLQLRLQPSHRLNAGLARALSQPVTVILDPAAPAAAAPAR
ncbi:MAG: HlyD family efflux transporter periplasmic adaptor subunit [Synechococcus sp.]|nr:HlyD family efflux transporter periplasmic adaptor subunit [Synechococcus sp.]